jgi:AcrR family transcriptional regulator
MRAAERRQQIMRSSVRVFVEEGYGGATTAKIAAAAGITEPTIYMHFKNTKDLFVSLLDETYSFMEMLLEAFRDQEGDLYARYHKGIKSLSIVMEDRESVNLAILWIIALTVNDPDVSSYVSRFDKTMMTLFSENLQKAAENKHIVLKHPPEVFCRILIAMANYIAIMAITGSNISRKQLDGVLDLILTSAIERPR